MPRRRSSRWRTSASWATCTPCCPRRRTIFTNARADHPGPHGADTPKQGATGALAAGFILAGGGAAFAHECFNTSTSENGTAAKAEHSDNWEYLPTEELIDEVLSEIGGTVEQQECFRSGTLAAMGEFIALGVGPARGTDSVIALNSSNTGDGRGIDHLFPVLVGVALDCGYGLDL